LHELPPFRCLPPLYRRRARSATDFGATRGRGQLAGAQVSRSEQPPHEEPQPPTGAGGNRGSTARAAALAPAPRVKIAMTATATATPRAAKPLATRATRPPANSSAPAPTEVGAAM